MLSLKHMHVCMHCSLCHRVSLRKSQCKIMDLAMSEAVLWGLTAISLWLSFEVQLYGLLSWANKRLNYMDFSFLRSRLMPDTKTVFIGCIHNVDPATWLNQIIFFQWLEHVLPIVHPPDQQKKETLWNYGMTKYRHICLNLLLSCVGISIFLYNQETFLFVKNSYFISNYKK